MWVNDLNIKPKDFLVMKWTPVILEWRNIVSSTDFVISFHWKELELIEDIKFKSRKIIGEEDFYFTVKSEYGDVAISVQHMLTMQ